MVENRPFLNFLTHLVLIIGVAIVVFPVYLAFIASTHGPTDFMSGLMPMLPGDQLVSNFSQLLSAGNSVAGAPPFAMMLANSLLMAMIDCRRQDRDLDHFGLRDRLFPLSAAHGWPSGSSS